MTGRFVIAWRGDEWACPTTLVGPHQVCLPVRRFWLSYFGFRFLLAEGISTMHPTLIRVENDGAFGSPTAVGMPTSQPAALVRIAADQKLPVGSTGFWECTPGRFRRQVPQAEYSYFITGSGSFTPDGGEKIEFRSGDAIYFAADTQGEWNILETVQKAYVIFE